MKNRNTQRIEEIGERTLIVGVDIAKLVHWARFVDFRGKEVGEAISFKCDRQGFESIVSKVQEIRKLHVFRQGFDSVIIGMEPTGHYWKTLANYLMKTTGYRVVGVNPYHTKKAKELDDNSQTKSDRKDALTIARLVKDGRFFDPYLPQDVYAELRILTSTRADAVKRCVAVKNKITAVLDEYFPEIRTVFKSLFEGKAARHVLRNCPFPAFILAMGEDGIYTMIKQAALRTVGTKKTRQLIEAAETSVGVGYGLESAKMRLGFLLDELEMTEEHIAKIELSMERLVIASGYAEQILSIKGIGVVMAAGFLGEVGDPLRFQNARQIVNYAGYNLVENSSGMNKSRACISKRGRSRLRAILYQIAFAMVHNNEEMKALHQYLISRPQNPLKKIQSLVVIAKKVITIIFNLLRKKTTYDPMLVFGAVRQEMMAA